MPRNYFCKTCHDTGTVGALWFKKTCPGCNGDPKSLMPKPPDRSVSSDRPPPKTCNHKCRCKDSL